ncbi:MAG TPA: 30S ribosomal protein S4 [Lentisphaeria bacterium]|nr:30S ribosomal protein S4 [Lentisphaeria bacterium]
MRQTGPACRICRREEKKLFLKGERCLKAKCAIDRERPIPGMHQKRKAKLSGYGEQLRAKQQIRRSYGLGERQFRKVFGIAAGKKGITSFNLLVLLEFRLDNIVYRSGLSLSRALARQMVTHGHIKVNGRRVNIPSYTLKAGDVISIKASNKSTAMTAKNIEVTATTNKIPEWISFDKESSKVQIVRLPEPGEIQAPADEQLVVELYSK